MQPIEETLCLELPTELVLLAFEKEPLSVWRSLPECDIQIPDQLVALNAYYRYVNRGRTHGFHLQDWYDATTQLRHQFRHFVDSLIEQPCDNCDELVDTTDELPLSKPKQDERMDSEQATGRVDTDHENVMCSLRPGDSIQEGRAKTMGPNHPPHTEDAFGNIWTSDRPIRSRLSAEEFSRRFAGYGTIVVEISSDRIFAAGNDEQQLAQGFHAKDLDVSDFQLEAGPLDHLDLSAAQLPDRLN